MPEQLVLTESSRGVCRVVMSAGANALDLDLLEALRATVAGLRGNGSPPFALISRDPRLFSPGWDLKRLGRAGRGELRQFLSRFNETVLEIFSYPGPTVAVVAGHAIAGGCLLALSCDRRVMVAGRPRIGLSEVNLGVPVPAESVRMLLARLAPDVVHDLIIGCDGYAAQRAQELGLVHAVAPEDRLDAVVEQQLRSLAAKPRQAYAASKRFLYEEAWLEMARQRESQAAAFLDAWFNPETTARIQALARSLGGAKS